MIWRPIEELNMLIVDRLDLNLNYHLFSFLTRIQRKKKRRGKRVWIVHVLIRGVY